MFGNMKEFVLWWRGVQNDQDVRLGLNSNLEKNSEFSSDICLFLHRTVQTVYTSAYTHEECAGVCTSLEITPAAFSVKTLQSFPSL